MSGPVSRLVALVGVQQAAAKLELTLRGTCHDCTACAVRDGRVICDAFGTELDDDAMLRGPKECPNFDDIIPF